MNGHSPPFERPLVLESRNGENCGVDVVRVVLPASVPLLGDTADVDRIVPAGDLFIKYHITSIWKCEIIFAEFHRVAASDSVGAVMRLVEASNVFGPQPHETVRGEIVTDLNHRHLQQTESSHFVSHQSDHPIRRKVRLAVRSDRPVAGGNRVRGRTGPRNGFQSRRSGARLR